MKKMFTGRKAGISIIVFSIFMLVFVVIRWYNSFMYCEKTYVKALGVTIWQYWKIQDEDRLLTSTELVNLIAASVSNGNDIENVTKVAQELTLNQFYPCIIHGRRLNKVESAKLDSLVQLGIHKCAIATRLKNEISDKPDWYWNLMGEKILNEKYDSLIFQVDEFKYVKHQLFTNYTNDQINSSFAIHGYENYQSFKNQHTWEYSRGYSWKSIALFN